MDHKIVKDFATKEEQEELINWILNNKDSSWLFTDAGMGGNRITTRYSTEFSFPETAYIIRKRIKKYLINELKLIDDFKIPKFQDGIVASYAGENDTVYEHKDPQWYPSYETLHCNLMLQKSLKGGEPVINKKRIELRERDLWCYYVSKIKHGAAKVIGNKPRLMFVFGFCVKYKNL